MSTPAHCSSAILAKLLNLSERRIRQLAHDGIIPKAGTGQYDIVGSIRGYLAYLQPEQPNESSDNYQQQKARLSSLQADLLELRLARENRQLISVAAVDRTWQDITIRAREMLLGMAPGLAAKVLALPEIDIREVSLCIRQTIEDVLILLAQPNYGDAFEVNEDLDREIEEALINGAD